MPPIVKLASGKTATPKLEWDSSISALSISLPDLSLPLVIAFGLGLKLPDAKGGFHLAFPSFKFGAKGEIEDSSDSDSDDEVKGKKGFGIKAPKFGFGKKDKSAAGKVEAELPEKSAKIKVLI